MSQQQSRLRLGLWTFHREASEIRARRGLRWWVGGDELRLIRYEMGAHHHPRYTKADAVIRCANRFSRMYSRPINNASDWNDICYEIGLRGGASHWQTQRVWEIGGRRHALLLPAYLEFCKPLQRFPEHEVQARAARIFAIRAARKRDPDYLRYGSSLLGTKDPELNRRFWNCSCAICDSEHMTRKVYSHEFNWSARPAKNCPSGLIRDQLGNVFYLCFAHRMTFYKQKRQYQETLDVRYLINQAERKIREASKVNA